jgi:hypothetical protein
MRAASESFSAVLAADSRPHWGDEFVLEPESVERILEPLRPLFSGYSLYALMLGGDYPSREEKEFFLEAAHSARHRGLVLMPNWSTGSRCKVPNQRTDNRHTARGRHCGSGTRGPSGPRACSSDPASDGTLTGTLTGPLR